MIDRATVRRYRTWVFDCDGVLLDSNRVKSDAFRDVAARYGEQVADQLVAHHQEHGGVSRFAKFEHLFHGILGRDAGPGEMEQVLADFADRSQRGLESASVDPDARNLLDGLRANGCATYVVSGGAQDEVRAVLGHHGLLDLFDGVYGSPRPKATLLAEAVDLRPHRRPAVMVGDSRLDLEVSLDAGLDAVFVSHWSEFADAQAFLDAHPQVLVVDDLGALAGALVDHAYDQRR